YCLVRLQFWRVCVAWDSLQGFLQWNERIYFNMTAGRFTESYFPAIAPQPDTSLPFVLEHTSPGLHAPPCIEARKVKRKIAGGALHVNTGTIGYPSGLCENACCECPWEVDVGSRPNCLSEVPRYRLVR